MSASLLTAGVQLPRDHAAPIRFDFELHALRVALVNRADVLALSTDEWDQPGVYLLIGPLGAAGPVPVRVGKATGIRTRLKQHRRQPPMDWWRAVAVVRDTTAGFDSAQAGYLEGRLAHELAQRPGVALAEGQRDFDTTVPTYARTHLDAFVETILESLRIVGLDLRSTSDQGEAEEITDERTWTKVPGTVADLVAHGFLSAGAKLEARRAHRHATAEILASGSLLVDGVAYRSPSTAAQRGLQVPSANGWKTWKLAGKDITLADLRDRLNSSDEHDA